MASSPEIRSLASIDEYLVGVRQKVDALRTRANLPAFFAPKNQRDEVRLFFMNRAIEIGQACFRVRDLGLPIFLFSRVLCEDLILLFWVSLSEQNAADYVKVTSSEATKLLRVYLKEGRGLVRHKSTGEDVTESFLPKVNQFITTKKTLADIADESGLSKVYDLVYRPDSLEVHANTFGLPLSQGTDSVAAALCGINAILKAMILTVDNPAETITAEEILRALGLEHLAGD